MKRKTAVVFLTMIMLSVVGGCTESEVKNTQKVVENVGKEVEDQAENIVDSEDEHVLSVKNGHPESYPDVTFGDAFEQFFGAPTWKYFESDDGMDVVEFTGYCTYQDAEVKARLQFILNDDGTFSTGALSFNDVPQSQLITAAMLENAFEQYAQGQAEDTGDTQSESMAEECISIFDAAGRYENGNKSMSISIFSDGIGEDSSVGNVEWSDTAGGEGETATLYMVSDSEVSVTLSGKNYTITFYPEEAIIYDETGKLIGRYAMTERYQS